MTAPTTLNKQKLVETFNFIAAHPDKHDQETWGVLYPDEVARDHPDLLTMDDSQATVDGKQLVAVDCGTAACFAGWAVLREGAKIVLPRWVFDDGASYGFQEVMMPDRAPGDTELVERAASRVLGLTMYRADMLFNSWNSRRVLRELCLMYLNDVNLVDISTWYGETALQDQPGEKLDPIRYDEATRQYV